MANIHAEGVLKDWLYEKGHFQYVDQPFEVDEYQLETLTAECGRVHPDYNLEKRRAWAVYSIVTKNTLSEQERENIGADAAAGIARSGRAIELQSRDFRKVSDTFKQLASDLAATCCVLRDVLESQKRVEHNSVANIAATRELADKVVAESRIERQASCDHVQTITNWQLLEARSNAKWRPFLLSSLGLLAIELAIEIWRLW